MLKILGSLLISCLAEIKITIKYIKNDDSVILTSNEIANYFNSHFIILMSNIVNIILMVH